MSATGQLVSAAIFDMDGVITRTASVHAAAWKRVFDDFLQQTAPGQPPFDARADYLRYVDGMPRYDGVRRFLASRGLQLPEGATGDPPGFGTVQALGNRKNRAFQEVLQEQGVSVYESTVERIHELKDRGVRVAAISASRNAIPVLEKGGVLDLFDSVVEGNRSRDLKLPGKPAPGIFLQAAREIGCAASETAIVEDSLAGVEAGRNGGFGFVLGVDRGQNADALRERGADRVVSDLAEISAGEFLVQEHARR